MRQRAKVSMGVLVSVAVFAVVATGCLEQDAVAGEGDEESSQSYREKSYDDKVQSLKSIPDEPGIELDEAPAVGSSVEKTAEEWKSELSSKEYRILRKAGTERPGSGDLVDEKRRGVYRCAACGAPLFSSQDKFHSGTGWPSFTSPYEKGRLGYSKDGSSVAYRVEVHCARCGGHLGHVFADGPEPTGKRYCINSVSLDFEPVSKSE